MQPALSLCRARASRLGQIRHRSAGCSPASAPEHDMHPQNVPCPRSTDLPRTIAGPIRIRFYQGYDLRRMEVERRTPFASTRQRYAAQHGAVRRVLTPRIVGQRMKITRAYYRLICDDYLAMLCSRETLNLSNPRAPQCIWRRQRAIARAPGHARRRGRPRRIRSRHQRCSAMS